MGRPTSSPHGGSRPRGMTLLEIMVASTIASIVIAAATSSVMAIYASVRETEGRAMLDAEAKILVEHIANKVRPIGGSSNYFRPWNLVRVANGASGAPDKLFIAEIVNGTNTKECPVTGTTGRNRLNFGLTGQDACCLTTDEYKTGRLALGTNASREEVIAVRLDNVNIGSNNNGSGNNNGACWLNFQGNATDNTQFVATLQWPASKNWLDNGYLGLVVVTEIWLDTTTRRLMMTRYNMDNGSGTKQLESCTVSAGVTTCAPAVTAPVWAIADEIYDFQVALGYDVPPASDGRITNTGATTDEWLFNTSGDPTAIGSGTLAPLKDANLSDLRMVMIGVTLGVKSKTMGGNRVQMLDGATRTTAGVFLRSVVGRVGLRNLYLFEL